MHLTGESMAFSKKRDFTGISDEECALMAFNRIIRSVSACEQSSTKMRRKLQESGYPEAAIDEAIAKALRIGAIDDKRYSECLIRTSIASGKGLRFALDEIRSLGIDPDTLESYSEHMGQGEEAEIERALEYLARHPSKAKDKRGAAYRKLVSKGYGYDVASTASRLYAEER